MREKDTAYKTQQFGQQMNKIKKCPDYY